MYVLITESLAYCQSSNENLMKIMHPEILRVIKFTDYICLFVAMATTTSVLP